MKSYLAHDKKSGLVSTGGLKQVCDWAKNRVNKSPHSIINIIQCRPAEGGQIIAEFDDSGGRIISNGRVVLNKDVMKLTRQAQNND